jgi:hypothetical protein
MLECCHTYLAHGLVDPLLHRGLWRPGNLAVPQRQLQQRAPAHAAPVEAAEDATAELTVLRRQESR